MSTVAAFSTSIYAELQSFYQNRQTDLKQLGSDLKSGNVSAAEQDFTTLAALGQSGNGGAYIFLSLVGGSVGAALIAIYIWVQKDRFVLVLGTAGQDVHASWAYSASYILGLLNAINNALASRY